MFYEIHARECEIIVFEVFDKFEGSGTKILDTLKEITKNKECTRLYVMTTNDNLDALRFYQKRNFHICGIHIDRVIHSRKLKPTIGMLGDHETELENYFFNFATNEINHGILFACRHSRILPPLDIDIRP